ncbi:EpsI family protein [Sphingomonas lutea]|uniref:EpsI family protein n=2 Tax=Sphingomonas lutea TaxID=1045317 RepID=A0A7G9SGZ8_9SPHN|nr:exosortase C-terminal domain/associated protein EpsI [Sphingomonas lutea]QNN67123.1 EpsI family protein [Sphingomonas lutea]
MGSLTVATATAAVGLDLRARTQKPVQAALAEQFPERLGAWVALEQEGIVRPPEQGAKSRYDQEVSRVFAAPDEPSVMLLVAYGSTQSDTLQVHRPEFCYPASGFKILETRDVSQPVTSGLSLPAGFFTAVRGQRVEQVLYWVRLGDYFPDSWLQQHLARLKNSARGLVSDGILVRASVIDGDAQRASVLLSRFLQQLALQSTPLGRQALLGRALA